MHPTLIGIGIMKKKTLLILLLAFFSIIITSCESEPQVTFYQEVIVDEPQYGSDFWGNITFKGVKKVNKGWLHWDENKECPYQNGYTFRILKNTQTRILKTDKCDHCHYSWDLHDDI